MNFVPRHRELTCMDPPFDLAAYNVWDPMEAIERLFLDDLEWRAFHESFEQARAQSQPLQRLEQSSDLVALFSMDNGPIMTLRDYLPAVDQNAVAASCWRLRPYHINPNKTQTLQPSITACSNEEDNDEGYWKSSSRRLGPERKLRKGGIWRGQCYISLPTGYFSSFTYGKVGQQQRSTCPPPY